MHNISYYFIVYGVFITPFLYSQTQPQQNRNSSGFTAPVDIPMLLSANYGEIRLAHFHTGIDIKTEQAEGKHVLAANSGYVFRIAIQSGGYGHVIYMKHPNDKITVYGHLSMFEPSLERYVKEQQYEQKSFEVDLYPGAGVFSFQRGDFLGLSGNSGSSEGPHLHFEIRDQSASIPLNALNYGFAIQDKTSPKITWLAIYPLDEYSSVNGANQKKLIQVNSKNNHYLISPQTIEISGKIGLGIETYDFLDNASNECSPYTLSLMIDENQLFFCRIDSIPFTLAGYVNSHIDYEEKVRSGKKIQKLFVDPNNKLKIYKVAVNRGIIQLKDTAVHVTKIIVKDTYGNMSELKFNLHSSGILNAPQPLVRDTTIVARFYYDRLNVFENQDIRVAIPKDALFDNINFQYSTLANDTTAFSAIHQVHNEYTPLFKPYLLSIRPRNLAASLFAKALIASIGDDGTFTSQGGEFNNGFVTARVKLFGKFFIAVDTIPPTILPGAFKAGSSYTQDQVISFKINDSLSGIRKYDGYIDKKWALFEYDAKNNLLTYKIDGSRLDKNRKHPVVIVVTDNKDNIALYTADFYY